MTNSMQGAVPLTCTPKEVATRIGRSERYWRSLCERGEIQAVKLGRVWLINRDALMKQLGLEVD